MTQIKYQITKEKAIEIALAGFGKHPIASGELQVSTSSKNAVVRSEKGLLLLIITIFFDPFQDDWVVHLDNEFQKKRFNVWAAIECLKDDLIQAKYN